VHKTRPVATDYARSVVCVFVCVFGTQVNCAKAAKPIEMPFGEPTPVDPRNRVLDGGPNRRNPFAAARGGKKAMRPFANYFGHLSKRPALTQQCGNMWDNHSFRLGIVVNIN